MNDDFPESMEERIAAMLQRLQDEYGIQDGLVTVSKSRSVRIKAQHSASQHWEVPTPSGWDTYESFIAEDSTAGSAVILLIFGPGNSASPGIAKERRFFEDIRQTSGNAKSLLLPETVFDLEAPGSQRVVYLYTDIFGPDFDFLTMSCDVSFDPEGATTKIVQDSFEALVELHELGFQHGCIQRSSMVMTYPHLKGKSAQELADFFESSTAPFANLDRLGTGPEDEQDQSEPGKVVSKDFKVKFWFFWEASKAMSLDELNDITVLPQGAPCPEFLHDRHYSPKSDIWSLATWLVDLLSNYYEFSTLLGGNSTDPQKRFREAQKYLGPYPPFNEQRERQAALEKLVHEMKNPVGTPHKVNAEYINPYIDKMIPLLSAMLQYDPQKRPSAAQALDSFKALKL